MSQAELISVTRCAPKQQKLHTVRRWFSAHVFYFTVLYRLSKTTKQNLSLSENPIKLWKIVSQWTRVILMWVPDHQRIRSNMRAVELSKLGVNHSPTNPEPSLGIFNLPDGLKKGREKIEEYRDPEVFINLTNNERWKEEILKLSILCSSSVLAVLFIIAVITSYFIYCRFSETPRFIFRIS